MEVLHMRVEDVLTTTESKLNFLKGLIRIAKSDSVLAETELNFYKQAAYSMGLTEGDIEILNECWTSSEKISFQFETSEEKMFFIVQAVQLCWIDDDYVEAERIEMRRISNELNISLKSLEKIEAWVEEGMKWNKKGDELLKLK